MRSTLKTLFVLASMFWAAAESTGTVHAQTSGAAAEARLRALAADRPGSTNLQSLPGMLEEMDRLIAAGASPNAPDRFGRTAVHYVVGRRHLLNMGSREVVATVLGTGGRCCDPDAVGDTPLHHAAATGIVGLQDEGLVLWTIRALLSLDADPNATNRRGYTPLHFAAKQEDPLKLRVIRTLLEAGADRNLAASDGNTPLHLAVGVPVILDEGHGHDTSQAVYSEGALTQQGINDFAGVDTVRILLDGPVDANARNGHGMTPLLVAVDPGINFANEAVRKVGEALLDAGADADAIGPDDLTPLQVVLAWPEAASRRASKLAEYAEPLVKALLDAGADPDRMNPEGDAPLHVAVRQGWGTGMVKALLNAGADPCVRNAKEQFYPDQLARKYGEADVESALHAAGGYQNDCAEKEQDGEQALDREDRREVQACLTRLGFDSGPADGLFGPRTRAAVRAWQEAEGATGSAASGTLSGENVEVLLAACEAAPDDGDRSAAEVAGLQPRCTGQSGPACWMETANRSGCYVWNSNPQADESVTWSGPCVAGKASGHGEVVWRYRENGRAKRSSGTGEVRDGRTYHGHWVARPSSGEVWEGPFVDDRRHGHWVKRGEGGAVWACWRNGERVDADACESPAEGRMQATRAVELRSGPGRDYEATGRLAAQDAVTVTGRSGEWVRIESGDGRRGMVPVSALTEPAGPALGETFRDCPKCPEMVVVPAGSFTMGSPASEEGRSDDEGPQHRVTISEPYAVGKYEVTFAEWDTCVAAGGCNGHRPDDLGWGRGSRPVIHVSWEDAKAYVAWLSRQTGERYRLLSEAEWEYAARAGTRTRYSWGDAVGRNQANCAGCGSRWDNLRTAPAGSFEANGFGLHDMLGNVWEWVEDCWHGSYYGAPSNRTAWTVGGNCSRRVLRGGSWSDGPRILRSADRSWFDSGFRYLDFGFRVARTLAP